MAIVWTTRSVQELRQAVGAVPDARNRQIRGKGFVGGYPYKRGPIPQEAGGQTTIARTTEPVTAGSTSEVQVVDIDLADVSGQTIQNVKNNTTQDILANSFIYVYEHSDGDTMLPCQMDSCPLENPQPIIT